MVLHAGPGDQLSGTAKPIGEWGREGGREGGGWAALSHTFGHNPGRSVPSGLSAKRISWMSKGSRKKIKRKKA